MKPIHQRILSLAVFSLLLTSLYGCKDGGGSGAGNGAVSGGTELVSNGSSELITLYDNGGGIANLDEVGDPFPVKKEDIGVVHNPEPVTALLLGSGLMIAAYRKRKKIVS